METKIPQKYTEGLSDSSSYEQTGPPSASPTSMPEHVTEMNRISRSMSTVNDQESFTSPGILNPLKKRYTL